MLELPEKHTIDKKAHAIIAGYLNENMLGLVRDKVIEYEGVQGK